MLLLALGAFAASVFVFGDEAAADVVLEPVGAAGDSPFTDPVAAEPAGSLADYAAAGAELDMVAASDDSGYLTADGSVPGIYGGSLNEQACDVELLAQFLAEQPERAEAWASVLEISPQDIGAYLDGLTPVHLGADARVVNHGFTDGEAVPRESVLQRGTAVLVDVNGVPRVNCYSGSPLREAEPVSGESFSDGGWDSFDPGQVLVVDPAPQPVEEFEIEDIETGELFTRPAGTTGDADRSGTVDLVDDGPIELNTSYDDTLFDDREEARYLFDVPDGAILTVSVANQRDSEHSLDTRVTTGGDTLFQERRLSPGDELEAVLIRGHDGGGEFEIEFSRGPAAFEFEIALDHQQDAGQDGDAGDSFDTAFEIEAGETYEGLLGDQDGTDLFLLDLQPGTELEFEVEAARENESRFDVAVTRDGDTLLRQRRIDPGASYADTVLFSGDDTGVLELEFSLRSSGPVHYRFTADLVAQADGGQPGDAGDERTDAREVTVGEQLAGQIGDFDGDDFYTFESTAEHMEIVVINAPDSDGRIDAVVEDDNTNTLDRERRVDPGQEAVLTFESEPGAEHLLQFSDRGRADYTFEIREGTPDE